MDDDNGTVAGNMSILDLQGVTLGHFLQMTPLTMKKMIVAAQVFISPILRFPEHIMLLGETNSENHLSPTSAWNLCVFPELCYDVISPN